MIPMLMKIKIPRSHGNFISICFPIFLVWLLLILICLLLVPFLLLAAFLTWPRGYGKVFLLVLPMIFSILWQMQGLLIDVKDKGHHIYFSFI